MKIIVPVSFEKKAKKFLVKYPELFSRYEKIINLLAIDPYHSSLKLHPLKGQFKGLYSISINISYRITLEIQIEADRIILVNIGSHDQVYK